MAELLALAALSARMMAESARRGGFDCIALDLFGDADTRRAARAWSRIGDAAELRLEPAAAIEALRAARDCIGWVAGSGTEPILGAVERGARPLRLIGNPPDTVRALRTPAHFFAELAVLGVAHPEIALKRPAETRGWLSKDFRGSGGWHVRPASAKAAGCRDDGGSGRYFQRDHAGVPMSALLLADRRAVRVVGLNELIVAPLGRLPYVYRGAVGPARVSPRAARAIVGAVRAIATRWQLVGLNSVDFLLDGDTPFVLEVNPRPSASMALYDDLWPGGLIRAHVEASLGRERREAPADTGCRQPRGHAIVFAKATLRCTSDACRRMLAESWIHDVPPPGTTIERDAPLCSVTARGRSAREVRARLVARGERVLARLAAGSTSALEVR